MRCYRGGYEADEQPVLPATPDRARPYVGDGRVVDLVAGYSSGRADPAGFAQSIRAAVREVAALGGGKLQVCEEVNAPAPQDGARLGCYEALASGLTAALDERDAVEADVLVGFNAAVALPDDPFWANVRSTVDADVLSAIDYLGLDFFPDVFRPIPPVVGVRQAVHGLVKSFRASATAIGIPTTVPLHITETGWPTGPTHSEEQQARTIDVVARAVFEISEEVHVDTYELFGLRDGLTSGPRMNRFGLMRDDHTSKPSFELVKRLIAEHS